EAVVVFAERLKRKYRDPERCRLYHILVGSTPREQYPRFDFPRPDSIAEFVENEFGVRRPVAEEKPSHAIQPMNSEWLQALCTGLIVLGFVLVGVGGYVAYYFGMKLVRQTSVSGVVGVSVFNA